MAIQKIHLDEFLQLAKLHPVLDVRSPGEFNHARIPGAHSFPLFTDEERKIVGTAYKQQSREEAIKIGLDFFGTKMKKMVEQAEAFNSKTLLVHCWRGGMRSAGVAWLLDLYGFKVYTLTGGYKFFRGWALNKLNESLEFKILGGYTGSGKTEVLKQLAKQNESVVDLELLANHKGSAFGNIGMPDQPSQEMFENLLATKLSEIQKSYVWLEDESQRIGTVNIPQLFWLRMRNAPVYFLDIPFNERLKHITEEYGQLDKERMIEAIERIKKRLGGLEAKTAIEFLREGKIEDAFRILLKYYDKFYQKGLENRDNLQQLCQRIQLNTVDAEGNANILLKQIRGKEKFVRA